MGVLVHQGSCLRPRGAGKLGGGGRVWREKWELAQWCPDIGGHLVPRLHPLPPWAVSVYTESSGFWDLFLLSFLFFLLHVLPHHRFYSCEHTGPGNNLLGAGPWAYVLIQKALGWVLKALVTIGLAKKLVWVFLYALTDPVDFLSDPVVWMLPGKAGWVLPQLILICFTPFSSFLPCLKDLLEAFGYVISVSFGGFDTDFCFKLSMTILKFQKCFMALLK